MSTLSARAQNQAQKTARGAFAAHGILSLALLTLAVFSLTLFASCASRASLDLAKLPETGAVTLSFATSLSPTAKTLLSRFTGAGSAGATAKGTENAPLFDGIAVKESLAAAGMTGAKVTADGTSLALDATAPQPGKILHGALNADASSRTFRIAIDRNTINASMDLMPASARDYLDLLMAPAFTGEDLSAAEYREILGATYGKTLSAELDKSAFTLSVRAPGPIKAAKTGEGAAVTFTGETATFTVPLITLLVLENPVTLEVAW